MRKLAAMSLLLIAACSDEAGKEKAGSAAETANLKLEAGQWETTSEIVRMTSADGGAGAAAMEKAAGTKTTTTSCITPEQANKPGSQLFAGDKSSCAYDNFYMTRGRLNASMTCTQPGANGNIMMNVDGTYSATSFEANVDMSTHFVGPGDMKVTSKISGRRIGACPAETPKQATS